MKQGNWNEVFPIFINFITPKHKWCWSCSSSIWPLDVKSRLFGKTLMRAKIEGRRIRRQQRTRWHHRFNGHEFHQVLADGEGQGSLECYSPWGHKELDITDWLSNSKRITQATVPHLFPQALRCSQWVWGERNEKTIKEALEETHITRYLHITKLTRISWKVILTWLHSPIRPMTFPKVPYKCSFPSRGEHTKFEPMYPRLVKKAVVEPWYHAVLG